MGQIENIKLHIVTDIKILYKISIIEMLRYQKPTVIEVKKADVDELLQKRREVIAKSPNEMSMCQPSLPSTSSPKFRQAEIRRRLGFSPDVVPNDGTTGIHF